MYVQTTNRAFFRVDNFQECFLNPRSVAIIIKYTTEHDIIQKQTVVVKRL